MNKMLQVIGGEPVVSTEILAEGFGLAHKNILALVRKYQIEFSEFGTLTFETRRSKGAPVTFSLLTEEQAAFLITLLRASPKIIPFKIKLTKEFFRMRKVLQSLATQKANAEWLEKRASGKIARRQETDAIKRFVEYATTQGSKSAGKYYMNISKMQNHALFFLEQRYPNVRDILNLNQLSTMEDADAIVSKALVDGMGKGLYYKEIYQLAKSRIETFAEIREKTIIPAFQIPPSLSPSSLTNSSSRA